ncbi:MAG: DNA-directed RNA polymerase subunit beta [Chloroflexi bacterium GWB2_49_20]|nr:MAG: DNA-directed RNA polymerase subunit beta [Chloroflexi bacterium GWB2_49_20]OGN77377.1 MAG: DNA-directed RNA polymerase subunit beta [Chloroflexi bacterium GWC2_49_37]OGN85780.1 MAG: DNA-directed RNA polymerase subunit beta [Chloroflexi bacterium GWD2_49_16]HBG73939.1 DNA-directed RNA polymerase subunit beta [Anaerolineae bacterium]HCC78283.1 DNA-directed RNA polymerase subunit beta [Anaerolineae bacterium]
MASVLPRMSYARIPVKLDLPNLIETQLDSFERLKKDGLGDLLHEISPIESYNKGMKLYFPSRGPESKQWGLQYWFGEPKHTIEECVERDLTYARPMYVSVLLAGPDVPEPIKQDIFLGDFPEMTEKGTFIINGTERVVVSQLIRSPGVYFEAPLDRATGRSLAMAKLIPDRGAWMEFETRKSDYIILKFNRKRTVPITVFLRALAAVNDGITTDILKSGTDEELLSLFQDIDNNPERLFITTTLRQEPEWDLSGNLSIAEAALIEFFKRMRPGDPATLDNARQFLEEQLFDQRHYDLERVGRYKLDQKLDLEIPISHRTLTKADIIRLIRRMILINNGVEPADDIDHLGNRRVKTVGELIQNKLRIGLRRMERVIKERMSIRDQEQLSPVTLVNIRPVVAALREFFGSSQLSQFMDQTNPLAELRHKRTLSALGPGGLRRERAGFDVRDVHHSHYGRICPIETPEGPNIGLIGRLASFARVNEYGFIETPYRRVIKHLPCDDPRLENRCLRENILDSKSGEVLIKADQRLTAKDLKLVAKQKRDVAIVPFVSEDMEYLSADAEDKFVVAQANAPLNEYREYVGKRVSVRYHSGFDFRPPESLDYMDVAPHQFVGISAALIPFLEHDDANRALMGSNMMAQAVPLVRPEIPLVSTGMEYNAARDSGQVVVAEEDGDVISVTGSTIITRENDGNVRTYNLRKYQRSNQSTCIDQRPAVVKGQVVKRNEIIADSSSTESGELALGQNVVVAFLSWEGGNFEDAILISDRLVQEDRFTSIHIEKHEVEARDTKLGPEEITRDIPNVGEEAIKDLDENGIIRVGAEVNPNDILVGKITPKGEKELTPEERLLRAIFGEKSRDVKDTSLRMPHGERGKVVDVRVFTREDNADLSAGVDTMVRVSVAQRRKITAGDKMAGRHGNKGVVSRVVPAEDMPFLEDGTPVEIILNPLGVPGRMNIGQVLEVHLGWAARQMGFRAVTPVFDGAKEIEIEAELARTWIFDQAWKETGLKAWEWLKQDEYDPDTIEDDNEVRRLYLGEWLGERKYDIYRLSSDFDYARYATAQEWLRDHGHDPDTIFLKHTVDAKERLDRDQNAIRVCLKMWLHDHGQEDVSEEQLQAVANKAMFDSGSPIPTLGKQWLRDGKTGQPYDQPVTVGVMTILKLHHLVEDKVHARSTGPYSLVTQQPLGGKAQFGGQRFGEMEVWALEAYGAAYTLQEMLTVKSDDVQGRVNTYEAIVKGEQIEEPSIPASFRVLVKELQSLGLAVEAVSDGGEVVKFGKDEEKIHPPKFETGLLGLGDRLNNY